MGNIGFDALRLEVEAIPLHQLTRSENDIVYKIRDNTEERKLAGKLAGCFREHPNLRFVTLHATGQQKAFKAIKTCALVCMYVEANGFVLRTTIRWHIVSSSNDVNDKQEKGNNARREQQRFVVIDLICINNDQAMSQIINRGAYRSSNGSASGGFANKGGSSGTSTSDTNAIGVNKINSNSTSQSSLASLSNASLSSSVNHESGVSEPATPTNVSSTHFPLSSTLSKPISTQSNNNQVTNSSTTVNADKSK
jgi:stage V sporulation protein SpoVS